MARERDRYRDKVKDVFMDLEEEYSIPWEINEAMSGLSREYKNQVLKLRNQDNALTIAKYLLSMKNEVNPSDNYRKSNIKTLASLSNFNNKPFSQITRDDLLSFLNSFRKSEPLDPLHQWIGTYNHFIIITSRFFKWLYYPDIAQMKDKSLQ